ncbi:MAG: DUF4263 domain-containing protein [Acidobacteria bacterium]|nr:DUF4263 domain-containing protein [Acidobacteriota bacterium]
MDKPDKIAGLPPVKWYLIEPQLTEKFWNTLEAATDERTLQQFFEQNPAALLTGIIRPHTAWVIPRPQLPKPQGEGGIPDFIICEWSSLGPAWTIVELESPRRKTVTKAGLSSICNHALEQIERYRTYLEDNALFLRDQGWPGIRGGCACAGVVIIGRRSDDLTTTQKDLLSANRRRQIEVMSYDRVWDHCVYMQDIISERLSRIPNRPPTISP